MINIGLDKTDGSFRYKRPKIQGKIEGRGNGIKTVLTNIGEISLLLHRDVDEIVKFYGFELGTQTKQKHEHFIINGAHNDSCLEELLEKYVEKFVLCPVCHLPETDYSIKVKSGLVRHKCKACSFKGDLIDPTHKLCKFIITKKKLKDGDKKSRKKKDKKDKKHKKDKKENTENTHTESNSS